VWLSAHRHGRFGVRIYQCFACRQEMRLTI
jgi:hypothetical protein